MADPRAKLHSRLTNMRADRTGATARAAQQLGEKADLDQLLTGIGITDPETVSAVKIAVFRSSQ